MEVKLTFFFSLVYISSSLACKLHSQWSPRTIKEMPQGQKWVSGSVECDFNLHFWEGDHTLFSSGIVNVSPLVQWAWAHHKHSGKWYLTLHFWQLCVLLCTSCKFLNDAGWCRKSFVVDWKIFNFHLSVASPAFANIDYTPISLPCAFVFTPFCVWVLLLLSHFLTQWLISVIFCVSVLKLSPKSFLFSRK